MLDTLQKMARIATNPSNISNEVCNGKENIHDRGRNWGKHLHQLSFKDLVTDVARVSGYSSCLLQSIKHRTSKLIDSLSGRFTNQSYFFAEEL